MDSANIHLMELIELNSAKEYQISQQATLEPTAVPFLEYFFSFSTQIIVKK